MSRKCTRVSESRHSWHPLLPWVLLGVLSASIPIFGAQSGWALLRLASVSVELIVNRVTAPPTLDRPPLNQRPTLYAQLKLDDQAITTGTIDTPQIGADVYPNWALRIMKERVWTEPGHPIMAIIRIFDQDSDDADDKVVIGAIAFDPFTCTVTINNETIRGDRVGGLCTVTIPNFQGEHGSALITLTAQW